MIKIIKPEGLDHMPNCWDIIDDSGMYIMTPCKLVVGARAGQAEIIERMVRAYNEKLLEEKK